MADNLKTFIRLRDEFEELTELKFRKIFKDNSEEDLDMSKMISKLSKISWTLYCNRYQFINYCRKRRNLIHYLQYEESYSIYTDSFITAFEEIVEKAKPISIYRKATKPVKQYDINSTLYDVLKDMSDNDFTHMPITEDWKLVWIISETSVVKYLAEHKEVLLDQWQKLSENKDLIDLKYSKDNVDFVAKDDDYDIVVHKFIEKFKKGQKLSCVLVTQNWKPHEWILWILTTWDIVWKDD